MKILHLGDLHIGKKVNGYSMIEDQKYVFEQMYKLIEDKGIETVLIAGDIYDRSIPSEEATELLDQLLSNLINKYKVKVIAISGNHDSSTRLDFSSKILEKQGLYIVGEYKKLVNKVSIDEVDFYLMPYVDPTIIRRKYKDILEERDLKISTHDDTMKFLTDEIKKDMNTNKVNIALYHGFVVGGGDSAEEIEKEDSVKILSVGGKEAVKEDYFLDFDYTALGHLHGCRRVKSEKVRYSGSPIKYSFSEVNQDKKFLIIDISKDKLSIDDTNMIKQKYEMVELTGTLDEVMAADIPKDAYLKVILTEQTLDAMNKLRVKYSQVMELQINIATEKAIKRKYTSQEINKKNPVILFKELAESVGVILEENEGKVLEKVIDGLIGGRS
ncbi:exonuclease SbcCD subunit D [Psychrilyobacter sp.]|uniref:exonuclease SbcCD subunit D n=1 Tax=Psychrilyobacter sp. TaxID=2586924 RepID=UPI0030160F6B